MATGPGRVLESLAARVVEATSSKRREETLATAADAQALREIEGLRVLLVTIAVFAIVSFPVLFVLPAGTPRDRALAATGMATVAAVSLSTYFRTVRRHSFRFDAIALVHAFLVACAVPLLTLGLGMCTALTGVFALGLLLLGTHAPTRVSLALFAVFALGHATLGALAWAGLVTTTGLGDGVPTPTDEMLVSVAYVEAEYVAALLLGLLSRRRWSAVLGRLESAVRVSSQREALLREVRADLDRVENLLGPGRFTGQQLGGFALGDVIGRGGMGEVYAAIRESDHREAAVKLLQVALLSNRDMVERFEREARTVSSLRSPFITEVLEFGDRNAPIPFIAMERLRGVDLAACLRAKGSLPMNEVLVLVEEVARGLDVAHAAGIVHRDLKPHNLFHAQVGERLVWKILDFGIAKATNAVEHTLTHDQVIGTPQYMAPEQVSGVGPLDRRTDVHALAALAFRALTGRPVWAPADIPKLLLAITNEIPPDPRKFVDIPYDVALVLLVGLAKRPGDRFGTALELHRALESASHGALANHWRDHAERLLADAPWGTTIATTEA